MPVTPFSSAFYFLYKKKKKKLAGWVGRKTKYEIELSFKTVRNTRGG